MSPGLFSICYHVCKVTYLGGIKKISKNHDGLPSKYKLNHVQGSNLHSLHCMAIDSVKYELEPHINIE